MSIWYPAKLYILHALGSHWIGLLEPTHTFFVKSSITHSLDPPIRLKVIKTNRVYSNSGELAASRLHRTMTDTTPLSATGPQEPSAVCLSLLNEEDTVRADNAWQECGERLTSVGTEGNMTRDEQYFFLTRCISEKLGLVDKQTTRIDKPRLQELVMKSNYTFHAEEQKGEFLKSVANCSVWQCLRKYCRLTSTA